MRAVLVGQWAGGRTTMLDSDPALFTQLHVSDEFTATNKDNFII